MGWVLLLAIAACSCARAPVAAGGGSTGSGSGSAPTTCDGVRPRVEELYRSEAQAREPTRVAAAVADNTAMVMTDCAKDPTTAVPCLARARSVAVLEQQCLVPLDDEGSEGALLAR